MLNEFKCTLRDFLKLTSVVIVIVGDSMTGQSSFVESSEADRASFIDKIKKKVKQSLMIVSLSFWGLDSSYTLHLALQCGLRPLVVHMDNGWNSELAQNNISNLVNSF